VAGAVLGLGLVVLGARGMHAPCIPGGCACQLQQAKQRIHGPMAAGGMHVISSTGLAQLSHLKQCMAWSPFRQPFSIKRIPAGSAGAASHTFPRPRPKSNHATPQRELRSHALATTPAASQLLHSLRQQLLLVPSDGLPGSLAALRASASGGRRCQLNMRFLNAQG